MEAHTQRKPTARQEERSPQVNPSMKYFAKNLEQHLDEVLEYVAVDEGSDTSPPMTALAATTDCQDAKIQLTSDSSKMVITKGLLSPAQPAEVMESAKDRKAALEWLTSVRQGRHKGRRRQKRIKLCPKEEEEEEGARTSQCTGEGESSCQQGRLVTEKEVQVAEEGALRDGELSSSSCDSDDSEHDRSKLEAVAVTFVGGVMQASHKS